MVKDATETQPVCNSSRLKRLCTALLSMIRENAETVLNDKSPDKVKTHLLIQKYRVFLQNCKLTEKDYENIGIMITDILSIMPGNPMFVSYCYEIDLFEELVINLYGHDATRKYGRIHDDRILSFMKNTRGNKLEEQLCILCELGEVISVRARKILAEAIMKNNDILTCKCMYYAILNGVLPYNMAVEDVIYEKCCVRNDILSLEPVIMNPIYMVIKLRNNNTLIQPSKFREFLDENAMFKMGMDPGNFDINDFRAKWWPLLLNGNTLRIMQKKNVEILLNRLYRCDTIPAVNMKCICLQIKHNMRTGKAE